MFLRFARGRVRSFWMRQTMTLIGSATLALLVSGKIGLITAVIALAGESLDCAVLHWIAKRYAKGAIPRRIYWLAALMGGLQALTLAACVTICWKIAPEASARFFALCFLMSAAINAGLVLTYFKLGCWTRLAVYAGTGLMLLLVEGFERSDQGLRDELFFVITALILAYATTLFIQSTERRQAERSRFELAMLEKNQALQAAHEREQDQARIAERLAMAAKYANDSVIFTSADGRIEWVNDAFTRITGYRFDEAIGHLPSEVLKNKSTSSEALAELARGHREGVPVRVEVQDQTRDGRQIWMEVSLSPVPARGGAPEVFITVGRDITQAKAHAAALSQARLAAEAGAQAKSQFLAAISHEIRTPMNGVIGMAELLDETDLSEQQRHYVTTLIDSGRALLEIINDVLDLAKLQAGKLDLLSEPFSINACVAGVVDLLQPTAAKKGLKLSAELDPDLSRSIGDAGRVRQILLNLLGNALKFTPAGEVCLRVSHSKAGDFDLIDVAVADTGIGIPPDRLQQIFESFTQAETSITKRFGGTGLGLTISRMLAYRMAGDILVNSTPGLGSVFTLTLRLPRADGLQMPRVSGSQAPPQTRLHVLVAEDNPTNMLITRKMLERCVGKISEAANGRLAVEAYHLAPPDLVLMDVSMPEMSGDSATRAIRAYEKKADLPRCPIVALTAYAAADEAQMCLDAGMDAVLTKPFARADLYSLLDHIQQSRDRFDLYPQNAVERAERGASTWSTSQRASGTTNGRSTRSSGP